MNITDALLTDISLFGDMAVASNGIITVYGASSAKLVCLEIAP